MRTEEVKFSQRTTFVGSPLNNQLKEASRLMNLGVEINVPTVSPSAAPSSVPSVTASSVPSVTASTVPSVTASSVPSVPAYSASITDGFDCAYFQL